jgi:hypothetical protein
VPGDALLDITRDPICAIPCGGRLRMLFRCLGGNSHHQRARRDMSSARKTEGHAAEATSHPKETDERPDHAANAQWLKDNPDAMPQVGAGRWAVYDRAGHLRGHLVGDGPTRDTRFKAISATHEGPPPDHALGHGITLHDAGAHLLDISVGGRQPEDKTG